MCVSFHTFLWEPPLGAIGELTVPLSFMSLVGSTFTFYHFLLSGSFYFQLRAVNIPLKITSFFYSQDSLMLQLCMSNEQVLLPDFSFLFFLQELWTWVANSPRVAMSPSSRPL